MCGIVGVINAKKSYDADIAKTFGDLVYLDTIRGSDSTGVAFIPKKDADSIQIVRKLMPGYDFVDLPAFTKQNYKMETWGAVIGHNRLATRGGTKINNTHPFLAESKDKTIILAHNGTLTDHWKLPNGKEYGTDSETIAYMLLNLGVPETIKQLDGSFALAWWDSEDDTINFVRNDKRPMSILREKNDEVVYFGSELAMLYTAANRRNRVIDKHEILDAEYHYKFSCKTAKEIFKEKLEMYDWKNTFGGYSHNDGKVWDVNQQRYVFPEDRTDNVTPFRHGKGGSFSKGTMSALSKEYQFYAEKNIQIEVLSVEPHSKNKTLVLGITQDEAGNSTELFCTHAEAEHIRPLDFINVRVKGWRAKKITIQGTTIDELLLMVSLKSDFKGLAMPLYKGPGDTLLNKEEWLIKTAEGCSRCRKVISLSEHQSIAWGNNGEPTCGDCLYDAYEYLSH